MFVDLQLATGQGAPPFRLFDLQHAVGVTDRIVARHRAFMLDSKHQIEIPMPTRDESCAWLFGGDGKLLVELGDVVVTQKLIGRGQGFDATDSELLRQASLPGAKVTLA